MKHVRGVMLLFSEVYNNYMRVGIDPFSGAIAPEFKRPN